MKNVFWTGLRVTGLQVRRYIFLLS